MRWHISRITESGAEEWVGERLGELWADVLLKEYGPGTFRLRGYFPEKKGGMKLVINRVFTLSAPDLTVSIESGRDE